MTRIQIYSTFSVFEFIYGYIYLQKIVRQAKKEFACNGTVVEHPEYGEVLQLQGDQRTKVRYKFSLPCKR